MLQKSTELLRVSTGRVQPVSRRNGAMEIHQCRRQTALGGLNNVILVCFLGNWQELERQNHRKKRRKYRLGVLFPTFWSSNWRRSSPGCRLPQLFSAFLSPHSAYPSRLPPVSPPSCSPTTTNFQGFCSTWINTKPPRRFSSTSTSVELFSFYLLSASYQFILTIFHSD